MRALQLPDEIVSGLEAVAALEHTTVTELAAGALVDLLADRYHAIQTAYVALRELDPDNGKPNGRAPVSTNGATKPERTAARQAAAKACARDGCDRKVQARGMCSRHYERWRVGTEPDAPDGTRSPNAPASGSADLPDGRETGSGDATGDHDDGADGNDPDEDDPPADGRRCEALRCPSPRADGSQFCETHKTVQSRLASKLRGQGYEDATGEAADRLIAGVR